MEDDRLGDLLRELPREQARPGFTARTLARLDTRESNTHVSPWSRLAPAAALAAVVALALSAGVLMSWRHESRTSLEAEQTRAALREIRAEHGRLARELRDISEPPSPTVVYLGGDEDVDLVLDLGKVRSSEVVAPAAYHEDTF
jgi:anti-sigma factor RsiW